MFSFKEKINSLSVSVKTNSPFGLFLTTNDVTHHSIIKYTYQFYMICMLSLNKECYTIIGNVNLTSLKTTAV